jgi:hypothetical protein
LLPPHPAQPVVPSNCVSWRPDRDAAQSRLLILRLLTDVDSVFPFLPLILYASALDALAIRVAVWLWLQWRITTHSPAAPSPPPD